MVRATLRGFPLLLLGAAGATAITGLGAGVLLTAASARGANRWVSLALGLLGLLAVLVVLAAPPVRTLAVTAARSLLGVDLPPVEEARDREGRLNALVWCLIVLIVGAVAVFLVLVLVPAAAALVMFVFTGGSVSIFGQVRRIEAGDLFWLPVSLVLLALAVVVPAVAVRVLQAATPRWLGPTAGEELTLERARSRELDRRNQVAAQLHDTIGHALTAIGVQADAGATVARSDPEFAARAFAAIRQTAATAVQEVDEVIGWLQTGQETEPASVPTVKEILHAYPAGRLVVERRGDEMLLPSAVRGALTGVLRESVTNAVRHGTGTVRVAVEVDAAEASLRVENDRDVSVAPGMGTRRGLVGMAARTEAVGGQLHSAPDGGRWVVAARFPVQP